MIEAICDNSMIFIQETRNRREKFTINTMHSTDLDTVFDQLESLDLLTPVQRYETWFSPDRDYLSLQNQRTASTMRSMGASENSLDLGKVLP
jgi:hypothetical protein